MTEPTVRTVLGTVAGSSLGLTMCHEHLLGHPPWPEAREDPDLVLDDLDAATAELELYRAAGGDTVVEVTTIDYGRDLGGLAELSRRTGVRIVAATGLHKERVSATYTANVTVDELEERFVRELAGGQVGLIKVGSSRDEITPGERKVFTAAAAAHRATGAPITTHTEAGNLALEQLDLLLSDGVDPERVCVGHLDRRLEIDYHLAVLRRGVYAGYDQVGKAKYGSDRSRALAVRSLVARGFGARLLVSSDLARRSYLASRGGEPGLAYVATAFLPLLYEVGVDEADARALLHDNPRRFLCR